MTDKSKPSTDKTESPLTETDRIFADPRQRVAEFRFDEAVARVFPDMIRRSVPGYQTILPMIGVITARFAQPGSRCYDLGCSLGGATLAMRQGLGHTDCRIVAVDNSPAMIERCAHYIALDEAPAAVELVCADLMDTAIENASVIVLNFTLQFVPPPVREQLLQRIHQGLRPGGVLILSEKLCFDEDREQQLQEMLYYDFKRANGYSELEISQKRSALEQVLIPETLDTHVQRLKAAGFDQVVRWYQCFNFSSLLAVRAP